MRNSINRFFKVLYYIGFTIFVIDLMGCIFFYSFNPVSLPILLVSLGVFALSLLVCIICNGGVSNLDLFPFNVKKDEKQTSKSSSYGEDYDNYDDTSIGSNDFVDVYPTNSMGEPMTDEPPVKIYSVTGEGSDGKYYERDTYGDGWHEVDKD